MSDHPMQPTPDQVQQWIYQTNSGVEQIHTAYAAGADAQLDRVAEWLRSASYCTLADRLLAAMRPKPPALAEQALEALARQERGRDRGSLLPEAMADADTIRRALERLAELEGQQDG